MPLGNIAVLQVACKPTADRQKGSRARKRPMSLKGGRAHLVGNSCAQAGCPSPVHPKGTSYCINRGMTMPLKSRRCENQLCTYRHLLYVFPTHLRAFHHRPGDLLKYLPAGEALHLEAVCAPLTHLSGSPKWLACLGQRSGILQHSTTFLDRSV